MRGIKNIKQALHVIYLAIWEKQISWYAKLIFILLVLAYLISPIDAIPEFIPVVGVIDDVLTIPLAAFLALWLIPRDVLDKLKNKTEK